MRRRSVESFVKGLGRCIVAMEACCGAHHLGRVFAAEGLSYHCRCRKVTANNGHPPRADLSPNPTIDVMGQVRTMRSMRCLQQAHSQATDDVEMDCVLGFTIHAVKNLTKWS